MYIQCLNVNVYIPQPQLLNHITCCAGYQRRFTATKHFASAATAAPPTICEPFPFAWRCIPGHLTPRLPVRQRFARRKVPPCHDRATDKRGACKPNRQTDKTGTPLSIVSHGALAGMSSD